MYSPEIQSRINELQLKGANGTLTLEDCKESIRLLREGRSAASASKAKASKSKAPVDTKVLFDQLDAL